MRPNGNGSHFFVLKIDYNGNEIWKRFYDYWPNSGPDFKVIQSNDGGFLMVGGTNVLKLDGDGYILWDNNIESFFNITSKLGKLNSVVEDANGYIYVVGSRISENPDIKTQAVMVKLNSSGNVLWEKIYEPSYSNKFKDIIIKNTGELIVLGSAETNNANSVDEVQIDFWVLNIDNEGNIIWNNTYGDNGFDFPKQIIPKQNGNYAFTGSSWGVRDISTGRIFVIDKEGNEIWNIKNELSSPSSIVETLDNGFILTGSVDAGMFQDLGIYKFDSFGDLEWRQNFQENFTFLRGYSILQEDDQGYRIAGNLNKNYYYNEERPLLLIYKTDPLGNYE